MIASGDSLADTNTKGIFNAGDGHQGHVAAGVLIGSPVGGTEFGTSGGQPSNDSPQHLVCVDNVVHEMLSPVIKSSSAFVSTSKSACWL